MEIEVNGEARAFEDDEMSVDELLDRLEIERTEGLAVAVDARVVTRGKWEDTAIEEGAKVEIIRATQGG